MPPPRLISSADIVTGSGALQSGERLRGLLQAAARPRMIASASDGYGVAGGWTVSGATPSRVTTNRDRAGVDPIKIDATSTSGVTFVTLRKKVTSISLTGKIAFRHFIPQETAGVVGFSFSWSSSAPAADPPGGAAVSPLNTMYVPDGEQVRDIWATTSIHPGSKHFSTPSGSGRSWTGDALITLPSPIQYIQIIVQYDASVPSAERWFLLDEVAINAKAATPMIMLGFDGFYASQVSLALPLFQKYGFKGYASSSGNNIAANLATCDALYANGWDLIQQAQRGGDPSPGGYGTNSTQLAADIDSAAAQFSAAGYTRAADVFTYPYNSRSSACDTILAAKGFRLARGTGQAGLDPSAMWPTPLLAMGTISTDNRTGADLLAAVDAAILAGEHLWTYGHDIISSGTPTDLETKSGDLSTFLAGLADRQASGTIAVVTPSEFLSAVAA